MLHLYFACPRWPEDGPWDHSGVEHLRTEIQAAFMDVEQLAKLAQVLGRCPKCKCAVYIMLAKPQMPATQEDAAALG